jgi:molybdopterin molybdotransferase
MLSVDEALARLLADAAPLPAETVPLATAAGRILAEPLAARLTQPPFDASAMDGYAIRWVDRAGPWRLIGEAAAGRGWADELGSGEAVRIFTGAPLPTGADTVMVQEDVAVEGGMVRLAGDGPPAPGAHIRRAGQDFRTGDPVAEGGDILTAARIGLVAAAGHGAVPVVRRPRVTLIATGDELVPPGTAPGPDGIVSSNGVMLAALLATAGADVTDAGIVPDRRDALAAAFDAAAGDIIVTVGGASVGDHDLVVPVLREQGAEIDFWKIAMRPGKPMLSGRLGGRRVVGLPGNPVSAFVCAVLFLVPLVRRLGGRPAGLPHQTLRLATPLAANGPRQDHLRGRRTSGGVEAFARQDSALLSVLARADTLIVRPPGAPAAAIGEAVQCILLDSIGDVS